MNKYPQYDHNFSLCIVKSYLLRDEVVGGGIKASSS